MGIASTRWQRLIVLLLLPLLLAACSGSMPTIPQPPQKQPLPEIRLPAELMTPVPESPVNVPQLLQSWEKLMESWRIRLALCKTQPQSCA